uniref:Uncharacterized protein n=1 Tax=Oryzias latipes TaxID=8090 RepID=A0A3P9J266_ORYLA
MSHSLLHSSKSTVFMGLMLLVLFSVSYQKTVKNTEDSSDLNRRVREVSPEKSKPFHQRAQRGANKKENYFITPPSSTADSGAKLRWQKWEGSLPKDAISVLNKDKARREYICRLTENPCKAGFYTPSEGAFCHYADGRNKKQSDSFEILVNEDNFEDVKWETFSIFALPKNPVRICENEDLYVGLSINGVLVVHPNEKCAPLISDCAALVVSFDDVVRQQITDVKYSNEKKTSEKLLPEILVKSVVSNEGTSNINKKVELSKKTTKTESWTVSGTLNIGIETKFEAGIPKVLSGGVQVTGQVSLQLSRETSRTEEISHSVSLEVNVPAQRECTVVMQGFPVTVNIPFTAQLTRTYKNNKSKTVPIVGSYKGSYVEETKAEVTECALKKVKG